MGSAGAAYETRRDKRRDQMLQVLEGYLLSPGDIFQPNQALVGM
jgi:hypothetical protein